MVLSIKPYVIERKGAMKRVAFIACLVLSFAFMVIVPDSVMAQQARINFGNLTVVPGISLQGLYDDNIYLASGNANDEEEEVESDWITHVKPSLLLNYSFRERGSLSLGYQGDFAFYSDNDENDWKNNKGILALNYVAPGGFIIGINEQYTAAEDPLGSKEEYKLGVPQTERWNNDLRTRIGYDFGNRLKVLLYYNYYKQDYKEEEDFTQDYDYHEYGAGLQMRISPKTWGFIRYHHGSQDYYSVGKIAGKDVDESNDADFTWNRVNAGLTWDTTAKLSGEVNFGYAWTDYDNEKDKDGNPYDDKDTWIAATAVTFAATPTTTLSLTVSRAIRTTGAGSKEYFEDTGGGISLSQRLLRKFMLTVGAGYSKHDFNRPEDNKREQDNYNANIGLNYQIQEWLSAGVSYTYNRKDSNYKEDEFVDNQVGMTVRVVY